MTRPEAPRVLLGRITGAHGLRGEVMVRSDTANPLDIGNYGPLSDAKGVRQFALKPLRQTPKGAIIAKVEGVSDRTAAERLAGTDLYVERAKLPPPRDGEYYHVDLIGLAAITSAGLLIGKVVAVQNFGAGDLLEIALAGGPATELIPLTDAWVHEVDIAAGRVVVTLPDAAADAEPDQ